ncbi:C-type mannose receptor 2-like [Strongylocentrotus purpuratus]|uniref:Macrophage mannose receptor 1-like n=1 Tax=Strongylocentrotus purpuratus TaxID=7668 RepID=A0A7M7MYP5_STRPU|nr:C-type mannose receptor 2-like [Strongylocentrotus purpuratus]
MIQPRTQVWLTSQIANDSVFWIGLSDRGALRFKWVDGTAAEYFNWAPGEPNEKDELHEDCVEMYSNGLWNDEQCLGMANPICERALGATGPPPTTLNYEPPCPEGWYKYDEQCILVVTNRDVFNSARDYCRYLNSDLVVVKTQGLNDFIANLISGFDDDGFWLGLTDKKEMYEFVWVDGTALGPNDYDNWMPNEPNESDGLHEDCVEMLANTGKWNDEQCVAPQKYICARPTVFTSTSPRPPTPARSTHPPALSTECGDGWMKYEDTCVLVVGTRLTFDLAQEYCQERHANLIKLESQDMNVSLHADIWLSIGLSGRNWLVDQTSVYSEVYWIGLYDRIDDNTFIWIDGTTPSFTNWAPNEPNNNDGIGEDCVEMRVGGDWNDEQCRAANAFVCSKGYEEIPLCDIKAGWEAFGDKCYLWVSDTKNIADATSYCTMMEGYVISINSADEQTFATSMQLRYANIQYWIGLSDQDNRGTFTWQDGTDTQSYSHWNTDENEPDSNVYPACGMIQGMVQGPNPDLWSVDECSVKKRFICEKPQGTCADGWTLHGGECYQFNVLRRTWTDASYYCSSQGGWLGTIFDGAENTFIAANMGRLQDENIESMWIGYSDYINDGEWAWVHETSSTYDNWPQQPNNTYDQADCAYLDTADTTGAWNQMLCTLLAGFFCKIKAGSTVTPVTAPEKVGSCELGWGLYDEWCYYSPAVEKTFTEAEAECAALFSGSHLASIHSIGEQSFITVPPSGRCGSGWVYDSGSNNCFKYSTSELTWPMANDQCHYEGGYLTSITNQAESEFHRREPNDAYTGEDYVEIICANGKWNSLHGDVSIGYSCKRNSFITDQFKVFPNSRLDTVSISVSNVWPEECAASCYNAGENCRSFNYYRKTRECSLLSVDQYSGSADLVPENEDPYDYYERGPTIQVPTTIGPSYGCGTGETGYRSYCYTLVTSESTFDGMQSICELRSANLVSIADASEMNFVISLMQTGNTATTTIGSAWLGLSDKANEATYAWNDGSEVTYTSWAAGQPQNNGSDEDCVTHNINAAPTVTCLSVQTDPVSTITGGPMTPS